MKLNITRSQLLNLLRLFLISTVINFVWEMLQMPLYQDMPFDSFQSWYLCFKASIGDGFIIGSIFLSYLLLRKLFNDFSMLTIKDYVVFSFAGLITAIGIEMLALGNGRWAYSDLMPIVPGIQTGLVPMLQLVLLTPFCIYLIYRNEVLTESKY